MSMIYVAVAWLKGFYSLTGRQKLAKVKSETSRRQIMMAAGKTMGISVIAFGVLAFWGGNAWQSQMMPQAWGSGGEMKPSGYEQQDMSWLPQHQTGQQPWIMGQSQAEDGADDSWSEGDSSNWNGQGQGTVQTAAAVTEQQTNASNVVVVNGDNNTVNTTAAAASIANTEATNTATSDSSSSDSQDWSKGDDSSWKDNSKDGSWGNSGNDSDCDHSQKDSRWSSDDKSKWGGDRNNESSHDDSYSSDWKQASHSEDDSDDEWATQHKQDCDHYQQEGWCEHQSAGATM